MNTLGFTQPLKTIYNRIKNTVDGKDFNRLAHEESRSQINKYDDDPYAHPAEGWEYVDFRNRLRQDSSEGDYAIEDEEFRGGLKSVMHVSPVMPSYHARDFFELTSSSRKYAAAALERAAEHAGESAEYASQATKFVLMEMARDVGWVMNCRTAMDTMRSVKRRFPFLADLKKAYEEGVGAAGGAQRSSGEEVEQNEYGRSGWRFELVPGWNHPRDINVASNLDNLAIIGDASSLGEDIAFRDGKVLVDGELERGRKRTRQVYKNDRSF